MGRLPDLMRPDPIVPPEIPEVRVPDPPSVVYLEKRTNMVKGSDDRRSLALGLGTSLDQAQRVRVSAAMATSCVRTSCSSSAGFVRL